MDDDGWTLDPDPLIGVIDVEPATASPTHADGVSDPTALVHTALDDAGRFEGSDDAIDLVTGGPDTVLAADPTLVVALGDSALTAVARADATAMSPVLPVDTSPGVSPIPADALGRAFDALAAGEATTEAYPLLSVSSDASSSDAGSSDAGSSEETRTRALFDVSLVTAEAARISEYGVTSRGRQIAQFRADGVVAATPAGSHGYASAADGPSLSGAISGLAVVPIAPFVTRTRHWVLPDDGLSLSVEREGDDVTLCVDDRRVGTLEFGARVDIAVDPAAELGVLETPFSRDPFAG
ncbi:NAD(+)/NADH kinase [Natronosalvus vescus]|uniref:NAD(+)/NADH kinase n=1 Tax=Natronosalvus vescus TaxID=2953881 RepID=UPI002090E2BA|nr:NAD(+)/NADH kinase [Natronosalvus vescus]